MTPAWAELYNEHVETYEQPNGKCQFSGCGHNPITIRHVMRHKDSGDLKEIGHNCFLRWKAYHGDVDAELIKYEQTLQFLRSKGGRISGLEYRRFQKETVEEHRIKKLKKKGTERVDFPFSHFSSRKEANEYAKEHEGYCSGLLTLRGEKLWCLYLPSK